MGVEELIKKLRFEGLLCVLVVVSRQCENFKALVLELVDKIGRQNKLFFKRGGGQISRNDYMGYAELFEKRRERGQTIRIEFALPPEHLV